MSLKRYLEKLRYIDSLIRKKSTGNQKMLAVKTGLSPSSLNNYLNEMKQAGFPIRYCRKRQTYYYEKEGEMVTSLFSGTLSKEDMRRISGGIAYTDKNNHDFYTVVNPV
jgi:DNA-binding IclR family transcriptional regulator